MTPIDLAAFSKPSTPLLLEIDTTRQPPESDPTTNKVDDDRFLSLVNKFVVRPVRTLADQKGASQTVAITDLFLSLKYEPLYISQSEAPLDLPVDTEAFPDSQLSGLDFDQLEDVANGFCMPRPSTWPTIGRPVTPPRIESLDTGKSSEATPSLSGSPVKSVSQKSPPPARPDRIQATVSANAADKPAHQTDSRAAVTLRSMPSKESISDYTIRVAEQLSDRLNIPTSPRSQSAHLSALASSGTLSKEKERTKAVLRKYDRIFEHKFGHAPSRQEKEPLRALYMYYRRVKHAIDRMADRHPLAEPSPSSDRPSRRSGLVESVESRPGSSEAGGEEKSWYANRRTDSGPGDKQLSKSGIYPLTLEEAERKLDKLVQQKNMLAKRLQAYQEIFEKKNGRRIRYHRDIVEIESEYRRYKKLRAHITALSETIKARRFVVTARGDVSSAALTE